MNKRDSEDLILIPFLERLTRTVYGAIGLGVLLTLLAFGLLSVLVETHQAYGIFALLGTIAMWVVVFLWAGGTLASKFDFLRDRMKKVNATVMVTGNDDEMVDRNLITIRVLAEEHRLKVIYDEIFKPEGVPPELANMKFRALLVKGTIRNMKNFGAKAEAHLKSQGMPTMIGGDASGEILKKED